MQAQGTEERYQYVSTKSQRVQADEDLKSVVWIPAVLAGEKTGSRCWLTLGKGGTDPSLKKAQGS